MPPPVMPPGAPPLPPAAWGYPSPPKVRRRRGKRLGIVAVVAALVIAGVIIIAVAHPGGLSIAGGGAGSYPNPCTLIKQSDVQSAFGTQVDQGKPTFTRPDNSPNQSGDACVYTATFDNSLGVAQNMTQATLRVTTGAADWLRPTRTPDAGGLMPLNTDVRLSGIGDEATWNVIDDRLFFRKGSTGVLLELSGVGTINVDPYTAMTKLAKSVAARM
jgi:hypothetical protein